MHASGRAHLLDPRHQLLQAGGNAFPTLRGSTPLHQTATPWGARAHPVQAGPSAAAPGIRAVGVVPPPRPSGSLEDRFPGLPPGTLADIRASLAGGGGAVDDAAVEAVLRDIFPAACDTTVPPQHATAAAVRGSDGSTGEVSGGGGERATARQRRSPQLSPPFSSGRPSSPHTLAPLRVPPRPSSPLSPPLAAAMAASTSAAAASEAQALLLSVLDAGGDFDAAFALFEEALAAVAQGDSPAPSPTGSRRSSCSAPSSRSHSVASWEGSGGAVPPPSDATLGDAQLAAALAAAETESSDAALAAALAAREEEGLATRRAASALSARVQLTPRVEVGSSGGGGGAAVLPSLTPHAARLAERLACICGAATSPIASQRAYHTRECHQAAYDGARADAGAVREAMAALRERMAREYRAKRHGAAMGGVMAHYADRLRELAGELRAAEGAASAALALSRNPALLQAVGGGGGGGGAAGARAGSGMTPPVADTDFPALPPPPARPGGRGQPQGGLSIAPRPGGGVRGDRGAPAAGATATPELDLHGQHAEEAVALLQGLLPALASEGVRELRVVTGVGGGRAGSGAAPMRARVGAWLRRAAAGAEAALPGVRVGRVEEDGPGALRVRLAPG